ncbi:hypothetical protein NECAME_11235 [Necator americanus]|uniref:7TM GPCR serpentine receptor class x (Srx) domain-containing protein n=1 Tax=Necator americanus TaxID=51031 RepID=W2T6F0_NECAM|nr:hypothetical protein NECAME_11235 [Necator americanus]ETN77204.1 hypothetical protein NECAME_11235 [Necator americanus]
MLHISLSPHLDCLTAHFDTRYNFAHLHLLSIVLITTGAYHFIACDGVLVVTISNR